jgi:hypothetical protein
MLPTKFWFVWPSGFRGEDFFRNQPIRNKNDLWWPCLLTNWDKMSKLRCFLPSFSSFGWGVSEEKIKMWKVNGRQVDGKSSHCLWQGDLKMLFENVHILWKYDYDMWTIKYFHSNQINFTAGKMLAWESYILLQLKYFYSGKLIFISVKIFLILEQRRRDALHTTHT